MVSREVIRLCFMNLDIVSVSIQWALLILLTCSLNADLYPAIPGLTSLVVVYDISGEFSFDLVVEVPEI